MFSKVCLQRPAMFCLYTSRNFPDHNLNFHCRWRWQDRIQATFSNIFYFTHLLFWSEFWCHLQILGLVTGNSPFNFVPSPFFVIFVVRRTTVNTITALTFIWIFKFSFNFCSFLFLLFYWKQKKNCKKCHSGLKFSFFEKATIICAIFLMVWTSTK